MKALTLWQPYLAGVLHGDAWCTPLTIGLRAKDKDFVETFAEGLRSVYKVKLMVRRDERGYWLARKSNKLGTFSDLRGTAISGPESRSMWLRGMFDSEGNACCRLLGNSPNAMDRRIAFYSTDKTTIDKLMCHLSAVAVEWRIREVKPTEGHKGKRTVYEVRLLNGLENFSRFVDRIGTSIARKAEILKRIVSTYQAPFDYQSLGGRRGCATRWGVRV